MQDLRVSVESLENSIASSAFHHILEPFIAIVLAIVAWIAFLPASHVYAVARFDMLGVVSRPYGEKSVLVSDDGDTVLATEAGTHERPSFIWRASTGLSGRLPNLYGRPLGLSGDGLHILGEIGASQYGAATRYEYDASFDGSVVVGYQSLGYPNGEAFRSTRDGETVHLGHFPGGYRASAAMAVSPDGNTIVGFSSGSAWAQPFRWTEADGMMSLGALPGDVRQIGKAFDVSADGQAVVGMASSLNGLFEAFRWTPAMGMQPLGDLPGGIFNSTAYDVSDNGCVVVGSGYGDRFGMPEAIVWNEESGLQSLADVLTSEFGIELGNFHLSEATSISANGRVIVGWGLERGVTDSEAIAWRVDLGQVPEPSTLYMISILIIQIALGQTRFRRSIPQGFAPEGQMKPT